MKLNFINNPKITIIKIIAIAFVTVIYSFGGILLSAIANKYIINIFYDRTDEELEKKSTFQHFGETTVILALLGIIAYIGKNILQEIPFPLEGIDNFEYMNLKEVSTGALILWILLNYSPILANKIKIIRSRLHLLI
jgi:hypothetical protein